VETDQDYLIDRRRHLTATAEDFRAHDQTRLARLPAGTLADQCYARQLLYQHVRAIWDAAKAEGLNPAVDPQWMAVAMLCDLTMDLWTTATRLTTPASRRPRESRSSLPCDVERPRI
jgi:hypothetical protein